MATLHQALSLFALIFFLISGTGADRSTKTTQAIIRGSSRIGAIVDTSSRIGKEVVVAMEVAKEGCYGFGNQTFLHIKDSQKDAIDAALEAKELIDTLQVQAIIGPHTWEEVSLVAEIAREKQVPILSFADTAPEWAAERLPYLLQASPDKRVQMKAIAAIVQSWNWHQVTAIYEDTDSSREPGIYAVQAYDSMRTIALALHKNGSKRGGKELLENILDTDFHGLSGKVKFKNQKVASAEIFQIVNVIGKSYNELGYWSHGVGFSKNIDGNKSKSMIDLGQVHWPGGARDDPNGWTTLRIGVPSSSGYKEYVNVENDGPSGKNFSGFTIEVFKETIKSIPFFPSYDFYGFDEDYNKLVEQIYLKTNHLCCACTFCPQHQNYDAVVGDVEIVASRYNYSEFTSPYTETGLVLIVPAARSSSKAWSFVKPFTTTMWVLISVFTVYNGFVVWWIERKGCDELQGSIPNQIWIMLWLSFNTLLSLNAPKLHSNLSRMSGVVWLFVSLIIIQTYTANLTSMLTVQRLEPTVPSVEELLKSNAKVGYCTGSYMTEYLPRVLKFKPDNLMKYRSAEEYFNGFNKKEISAAFIATPYAKLFLGRYCNRFIQIGETYKIGGFGFAFPRGSPLLASVNEALLKITENGTVQALEKTWITPEKCPEIQSESSSLGPNGFLVLFYITGGTTTAAFVIYVCRTNLSRDRKIWRTISAVPKRWCSLRTPFTTRVASVEIPTHTSPEAPVPPASI
ncbi:hypothetical protein OIU84_024597 [Salix udensis]|uniref:Ionotropic glutamate receptor C-terminal domain-containing protein n=1 Tax=Salix udensis TaxID=889485 RepID=A0AAD6KHR7_9ROSI|nr:hypothetical protein OIU84_024597 [Salix udensis]